MGLQDGSGDKSTHSLSLFVWVTLKPHREKAGSHQKNRLSGLSSDLMSQLGQAKGPPLGRWTHLSHAKAIGEIISF